MKKWTVLVFTWMVTGYSMAYAQLEKADLDSLYAILKRTPSYKDQISGDAAIAYHKLYLQLRNEMKPGMSNIDQFRKLTRLLIPINDNHLDIMENDTTNMTVENLRDSTFMKEYRNSRAFKEYPTLGKDLLALGKQLCTKPGDNIEGLYYYSDELKVGLVQTVKNKFTGVVLESNLPNWTPGQILLFMERNANNTFNTWMSGYVNKKFYFSRTVQFRDGQLLGSGLQKFPKQKNFENISTTPSFKLTRLSESIQYLKLTNFKINDKNVQEAQQFYTAIKDSLHAPNLIVDLRNNGGGYYKVSSQFLNLLRFYARPGKIFLLANYYTVSNAEQFTIKVKGLPDVTVLGSRTMGRITYGQNYGTRYTLPSGEFSIVPTDMGGEKNDFIYEGVGITPDLMLDSRKDWIEQTKVIIQKKDSTSHK